MHAIQDDDSELGYVPPPARYKAVTPMEFRPRSYEEHPMFADTIPSDYTPIEAAHAASEIEDQVAAVTMLGRLLVVAGLAATALGVVGVVAWLR